MLNYNNSNPDKDHGTILTAEVKRFKTLARMGKPDLKGDSIEKYTGQIHAKYDQMLATYIKKPIIDDSMNEMAKSAAESKQKQLTSLVRTLGNKIEAVTDERQSITQPIPNIKGVTWMYGILVILPCFDATLTRLGFMVSGESTSMIGQAAIFLFLVVVYAGLGFALGKAFRSNSTNKIALRIGAVLAAVAISVGFSLMRNIGVENMSLMDINAAENVKAETLPFYLNAILQCILLFLAGYITYMMPTSEERKLAKDVHDLETTRTRLEAELTKAERDLVELPQKAFQTAVDKSEAASANTVLERKIEGMRAETINTAIHANIAERPDGGVPDCFSNI